MLTITEFRIRTNIEGEVLESWMAAGWLVPIEKDGQRYYTETDVARVELIQDLRRDLGVNEEGIDVILDLLDQIHGLRATVSQMMEALRAQPDTVRAKLVQDARLTRNHRRG